MPSGGCSRGGAQVSLSTVLTALSWLSVGEDRRQQGDGDEHAEHDEPEHALPVTPVLGPPAREGPPPALPRDRRHPYRTRGSRNG